jgi:hypothetical protein
MGGDRRLLGSRAAQFRGEGDVGVVGRVDNELTIQQSTLQPFVRFVCSNPNGELQCQFLNHESIRLSDGPSSWQNEWAARGSNPAPWD